MEFVMHVIFVIFKKKLSKVSRGASFDHSKAVPTPLPLPCVAGLMHQEIESERNNGLSRE